MNNSLEASVNTENLTRNRKDYSNEEIKKLKKWINDPQKIEIEQLASSMSRPISGLKFKLYHLGYLSQPTRRKYTRKTKETHSNLHKRQRKSGNTTSINQFGDLFHMLNRSEVVFPITEHGFGDPPVKAQETK